MRGPLLLALVLVSGCHKPGRFTDQLASVKHRLVNVVASGAISVDTAKAIQAASQAPPPRTRVEEPPPVEAQAPARQEPPPARAPAPDVQVTRVNAARPTVFVLRGQTHGGKGFCETHPTQDACNSACSGMLRANALTKPDASTPKSCACTELDKGC